MTQALNLANFANNLNTAGATSNSGLQNSSVTVTAGTGMSGGGAVALGSSVTLTNAGVTSIAAGTGISVSASTGGVTITNTSPGTSYSAGNGIGISGGSISVACPTFGSVGSYIFAESDSNVSSGGNYSVNSACLMYIGGNTYDFAKTAISGSWKWMGASNGSTAPPAFAVACRVS